MSKCLEQKRIYIFKIFKGAAALLLLLTFNLALADSKKLPGLVKRSYHHVCPAGTDRVGEPPPKNTIIFCKQPLANGSRLEGDYVSFYRNGNKREEGEYVSGKRHGSWASYYRTGEINEKKEYVSGKVVEKEAYTRTGQKIKRNQPKTKTTSDTNPRSEFYKASRYSNTSKSKAKVSLGWGKRSRRRRR